VVDYENQKVVKFNSTGAFVLKFGTGGSGNGQFGNPWGIALDETGQHVYVIDSLNCRVQKFTLSGEYVSQFGQRGDGDGQFQAPCGIAVDCLGNIYVTDTLKGKVQKFDSTGAFRSKYGDGTLSSTQGCIVRNVDGVPTELYVADSGNSLVRKYNLATGELALSFGGRGDYANGKFRYPTDVKIGPNGNLFVLEYFANCRIQEFDLSGNFIRKIRGINCGTDDLYLAGGIAFDNEGRLYVSDVGGHRVARFAPSTGPALDAIAVTDISPSSATVSWITDVPSTSAIDYWKPGQAPTHIGDTNPLTIHMMALSGLQPNTLYRFKVTSRAGTDSSISGISEFWTLPTTSTIEAENSVDTRQWGTWSKIVDANASCRAYLKSDDTATPAHFFVNFVGTGVNIRYIALPEGGKANYYLDKSGSPAGTIDFYAPTASYDQSLEISGLPFKSHELLIEWAGGSSGGGNTLALDRFEIMR